MQEIAFIVRSDDAQFLKPGKLQTHGRIVAQENKSETERHRALINGIVPHFG